MILFLELRYKELAFGGQMVLTFLGRKEDDVYSGSMNYIYELLAQSLQSLVEKVDESWWVEWKIFHSHTPQTYVLHGDNKYIDLRTKVVPLRMHTSNYSLKSMPSIKTLSMCSIIGQKFCVVILECSNQSQFTTVLWLLGFFLE